MSASFSWARVAAIVVKEFPQMLRDRLTFAMAIGVPVMQLVVVGHEGRGQALGIVKPLEVMIGKIAPYVIIGYVQLAVIIAAATLLFEVPIVGSFSLLMVLIGLFMLANLGVGFTFSTLAKNQLRAMQMTFFFFLPSMLLLVSLPRLFLLVAGAIALRRYRQTLD